MLKVAKLFAAGAVAVALFGASHANAQSVAVNTGDIVDGWKITYPQGVNLTLTASVTSGPTLTLQKTANFTDNGGLLINFIQTDLNAASKIAIDFENLSNNTGTTWNGFDFVIFNPGEGQDFENVAFNQSTFDTTTQTTDLIALTGGTLASGTSVNWGTGFGGGELLIDAQPSDSFNSSFTLKEIPTTGGGSSVPVPAAAWTGLSGLLGLGLLGAVRKMRGTVA